MKLEELVPPLELCKLIPKGEFEDCAFLWEAVVDMNTGETVNTHTVPRPSRTGCNPFVYHEIAKEFHLYPAPTLEEILQELFFISHGVDLACFWDGGWHVKTTEGEKFSGISPVCGALKLWLELKGIEYEKA